MLVYAQKLWGEEIQCVTANPFLAAVKVNQW